MSARRNSFNLNTWLSHVGAPFCLYAAWLLIEIRHVGYSRLFPHWCELLWPCLHTHGVSRHLWVSVHSWGALVGMGLLWAWGVQPGARKMSLCLLTPKLRRLLIVCTILRHPLPPFLGRLGLLLGQMLPHPRHHLLSLRLGEGKGCGRRNPTGPGDVSLSHPSGTVLDIHAAPPEFTNIHHRPITHPSAPFSG